MADIGQQIDRRTVLRSIVASGTVVAGAGLASDARASPSAARLSEIEREYGDLDTVEGLFESYGEPVRAALVDGGYLDEEATVSVESVVSRHEYGLGDESDVAAVSAGRRDGTEVVDVRIRQRIDDAAIEYHLNPGVGGGYAYVRPDGSDPAIVVFGDGTEEELTSTSCCPAECDCGEIRCTNDDCDCQDGVLYHYEEQYCCEYSDGACLCGWETIDCDCPEDVGGCLSA